MNRCLGPFVLLLAVVLAAGCGGETAKEAASPPVLASEAAIAHRSPPPPVAPALATSGDAAVFDAQGLVPSLEAFGLALLEREAQANASGNVVISPVSIADALTMTLNGARGETARQMHDALCLGELSLEQADRSWAGLIASAERKSDAEIRIANSLWLRQGVAFEPDFLNADRDYFAADAHALSDDGDKAAADINGWVEMRTGGRIRNLVERIDALSPLVLVNATCVRAGWDYFEQRHTREEPFVLASGEDVRVPMMHGELHGSVTQTSAYLAVPLSANGRVGVTIVLPKAGETPESVLPMLTDGGLAAVSSGRDSRRYVVDLALPRFKAEFADDSVQTRLTELGMVRAFSSEAEFQGIAPGSLWIDQVIHKAILDIKEEGIEAAAGTAVVMYGAGPPTKHLSVRVDHPFIVIVNEGESGAPLFMAVVRDPR